jgi:hypothetical protein
VPVYLHLVLRLHTADMADSHCAHVLTSGIAFTYSGLSMCPCLYILYCIYMQLIWWTITVPMHLHLVLHLHTADMADYHCACVLNQVFRLHTADYHCDHILTSGIALYMHLTTAYATSRPVLYPAIAIGTVQSYSCLSVTLFRDEESGLKNHTLFIMTIIFQFHASALFYSVKELSVPTDQR